MKQLIPIVLVLSSLIFGTQAHALQCLEIHLDEEFDAAARVVVAKLQSIDPIAGPDDRYRLTFGVLDVLKGPSTEEIELTLIENPWLRVPGAYPAELTYLMFLRADQDEIGLCERILMLEGQTAEWYTQHRR